MRKLDGHASEREQWLVTLCLQRAVELAAMRDQRGIY